ncbi:MAG: hypothetical protein H6867_06175 [Rhodospirillales bacterium]|nr:hypothetical protein [Rhodospirillales bacterium]MCB9995116.1 hypothetical protein [Rhodospirillales bacterium]
MDDKNYFQEYVETTMHEFKTHISRYVRMMEAGLYKAVIVKRGTKPVGVFMLHPDARKAKKDKGK